MSAYKITLAPLSTNELPSLQPLVDELVATHRSMPFKEDYWDSFQQWLLEKKDNPDILALAAHVDVRLAGVGIGTTQQTSPLLAPERIGYVNFLVVAPQFRNVGVGKALWNGMRQWFLSQD